MATSFVLPAAAAPTAEEFSTVLNLSGRQRMLTQKMSKEVALVAAGINAEANLKALKGTRDLFDKTLIGLRDGDADVGLPPTESARIKRQLVKVERLWLPFRASIDEILEAGEVSPEALAHIATSNLPLLKEMNRGVQLYEREAKESGLESNPALAVAINLSGKQRMLTQKMSKEYFLIHLGFEAEDNQYTLLETVDLFDRTLTGLLNGDDVLELPASPSDEITAQLNDVVGKWGPFKAAISKGTESGFAASDADLSLIEESNVPLLKSMNAAVKLYELEASSN